MTVLLDNDVLLDVILERDPWHRASALVLDAVERGRLRGLVASHSIPTVYYLVTKNRGRPQGVAAVNLLLDLVEVVPVTEVELRRALAWGLVDFEDAVQLAAATTAEAAFVVTRNTADYPAEPVPAIVPEALLAHLR